MISPLFIHASKSGFRSVPVMWPHKAPKFRGSRSRRPRTGPGLQVFTATGPLHLNLQLSYSCPVLSLFVFSTNSLMIKKRKTKSLRDCVSSSSRLRCISSASPTTNWQSCNHRAPTSLSLSLSLSLKSQTLPLCFSSQNQSKRQGEDQQGSTLLGLLILMLMLDKFSLLLILMQLLGFLLILPQIPLGSSSLQLLSSYGILKHLIHLIQDFKPGCIVLSFLTSFNLIVIVFFYYKNAF